MRDERAEPRSQPGLEIGTIATIETVGRWNGICNQFTANGYRQLEANTIPIHESRQQLANGAIEAVLDAIPRRSQ